MLLQHKTAVVQEYETRLTPSQRSLLMHHPGRTTGEIDDALEQILEYNERLRRAADARVEIGERQAVHGESSPYQLIEDDEAADEESSGADDDPDDSE